MDSLSSTILVVDDDELQRDMVGMQLTNLGYRRILLAASGLEALTLLDSHPHAVRLIISDLSMPDMDGLVLIRHLAQRGFNGDIIVLSGMQDDLLSSAVALASAHGLNVLGCLSKPSKPDKLHQLLNSLNASTTPACTS
jgi:CheY-like chemotaxis protein